MHFRNVKKTAGDVYISDPIDSEPDNGSITLMDIFSDEESLIDNIDLKLNAEKLYRFIAESLDVREKRIIELRYGLGGRKPLPQREIAKKLDISRSYVSRIEKKALEKLKRKFETDARSADHQTRSCR